MKSKTRKEKQIVLLTNYKTIQNEKTSVTIGKRTVVFVDSISSKGLIVKICTNVNQQQQQQQQQHTHTHKQTHKSQDLERGLSS